MDNGDAAPDGAPDAGDTGSDAGLDTGQDAMIDAGEDANIDGGGDLETDGGFDGGEDGGLDAGQDSGGDAGPDGALDAGDTGSDAGFDAGQDAMIDSGEDANVDSGGDVVLDGGHDVGEDSGQDAGQDGGGGPFAVLGISDGPTYDFGLKTIGSTTEKTFAVTNSGGVAATLGTVSNEGLELADPFTHVGGTCTTGAVVAPAGECTIILHFAPMSASSFYDSIDLAYYDGAAIQIASRVVAGTGTPVPTAAFVTAIQGVSESVGTVTVTVSLSTTSVLDVSVPFTVSGTSTNPADHDLGNGSIVVAAGQTMGSVTFNVINDALDEDDETVVLTMGTPTNATQGATTVHTVTISDNDPLPTVDFSTASQSVGEAAGTVTVSVTLSATSGRTVTVPFTVAGTASNPADYTITASPVVIPPGFLSTDITITISDDTLDENDETVVVTTGVPTNATAGATNVHTATITDNDAAPTVNFTSASQRVGESAGTATITAQLSAISGLDVILPFTPGGTANNPADYTITASPIAILAGSLSADSTVMIVNDTLDEDDETVVLTMGTPTNATIGATTVHTVTITDNDPLPTVSFSAASQLVGEAAGTVTVSVALSAVSGLNVSVPFTVSGTASNPADHDLANSNIMIPAGQTTGSVIFNVVNDALDEDDEAVILTMGTPTNATQGATTVHTVTITDNDPMPTVSFSAASQSVSEAVGTVTVSVMLSAMSGRTVTVPFTVSGTASNPADHDLGNGSIVVVAGQTTGSVMFNVFNDALDEDDETVVLTMGAPTNATQGATTLHTVTIIDNELLFTPIQTISIGGGCRNLGVGDIDGDGDADVIVGNVEGSQGVKIFKNDGLGGFAFYTTLLAGNKAGKVLLADFDGDGDLDLATFRDWLTGLLFLNNGTGDFTDFGTSFTNPRAMGDLDNDGDVDIVAVPGGIGGNAPMEIWKNNGSGVFTKTGQTFTENIGSPIIIVDFDGDGDLDVVARGYLLYKNNGDGSFVTPPQDIGTMPTVQYGTGGSYFGDIDNDGDMDLVNGNYDNEKIYRYTGGAFTETGQNLGGGDDTESVTMGDVDNDGDLDLITVNYGDSVLKVFLNDGTGLFTYKESQPTSLGLRGALVDIDNDGDLDIISTGWSTLRIYRNNSAIANTFPAAPTVLSSTPDGNSVTLTWNNGADTQTPANMLTYNLQVGTSPGGNQVFGKALGIPHGNNGFGAAWHTFSKTLNNLPSGTYYWSVQTVDTGYGKSSWSAENSFTITDNDPIRTASYWWKEDACGEYHTVYVQSGSCYLSNTSNPFGAWDASIHIDTCDSINIQVDRGSTCNVHLAYNTAQGSNLKYYRWDGTQLLDLFTVNTWAWGNGLLLDDQDQPHLFWSNSRAYHRSRNVGGTWNSTADISTGAPSGWNPSIIQDANGIWRATFRRAITPPSASAVTYESYSLDDGNSWQGVAQLFPDFQANGWYSWMLSTFNWVRLF